MDLTLFPKNEEWGTGDEALDSRLNVNLKKTLQNLSIESIADFFSFALSLKTRAYNPAYSLTIDQVAKALLFHLSPDECNDALYKKMRGHYFSKSLRPFSLKEVDILVRELKSKQRVRYQDQIDFSLHQQSTFERNPFVQYELKKSPVDLQAKILFKEFRSFLDGVEVKHDYANEMLQALKYGRHVLVVDNFAEIWYEKDQLFSIALFS